MSKFSMMELMDAFDATDREQDRRAIALAADHINALEARIAKLAKVKDEAEYVMTKLAYMTPKHTPNICTDADGQALWDLKEALAACDDGEVDK